MMNKKGGVPDAIFYMVALFAVAIISIVGYVVLTEFNDNFAESNAITDQGKELTNRITNKYVGIIDAGFLMIFVGILIATVVGVWFIRTHPALFWIMIPIFAFIIFLAAIYANVYFNFAANPKVLAAESAFTIIPFIFDRYALIITGSVILIAIALFAKGRPSAT